MKYTLIILVSITALIITFVTYNRFSNADILLTEEIVNIQQKLSILVYLMLSLTLPAIAITIYKLLKLQSSKNNENVIKNILIVFNDKKYVRIFIISLILYAVFYSFITGLLVYRVEALSAPSFKIIPCCNFPGYMPILIISITEHFGMIIIPLNLILLIIVSTLVAINIAISIFIYDNRSRNITNWLSGFGSIIGLFTGCPTCAGTFFLLLFGLSSSTLAMLAPLQSLFIASSIPILLFTPILMLKRFSVCRL